MRQTFKKEEKLNSLKIINDLFVNGKSIMVFPFKIIYYQQPIATLFPAQVLISVSKRKFKKAVDRNKVKRLIREAYRKNKHIIYDNLRTVDKQYAIAIMYIGDKILPYSFVEEKIMASLNRLCEQFKKE